MQAIDEQSIRRESFTQGESFLGKDLQTWHLPKLDHVTIGQSKLLAIFVQNNRLMAKGGELRPFLERTRFVLLELLLLNYLMTFEEGEMILGPKVDEDSDIGPIVLGGHALLRAIGGMDRHSRNCIYSPVGSN